MKTFEEFGLSNNLLTAIKKIGIEEPTQIQEESIPHIMAGEDVVGESATGSGKTLAYTCGIIEKINTGNDLQALILVPTRELAEQVRSVIVSLSHFKPFKIITVYGGVAIGPQIRDLSRTNIAIATPGRLLDHIDRGTINLSKVKLLILDEADRMFDMGFMDDVRKIIKVCPVKRQTLFFSATLAPRVRSLAKQFMINPVEVSAKNMVDPSKLKQIYYDVPKNLKLSLFIHLLKNEKSGLVMVFCNTRNTADFVFKNLKANKINAIVIHGGLSQNKRTRTIELFHEGRVNVLVCTDVASRGLHIDNVSHIYNFDLPKDSKEYVHRIGRTARAGEEGKVVNLLCETDYDNFARIQDEYRNFTIEKTERPYLERVVTVRNENFRRPLRPRQFNPRYGRR